jgi:hypothetical protein
VREKLTCVERVFFYFQDDLLVKCLQKRKNCLKLLSKMFRDSDGGEESDPDYNEANDDDDETDDDDEENFEIDENSESEEPFESDDD